MQSPSPSYQSPDLALFSQDQLYRWLLSVEDRLIKKQARERAYLDRRAARGTRTPTDDAYEADQQVETDLLALLDLLKKDVSP